MKRITLLILLFFVSLSLFAQQFGITAQKAEEIRIWVGAIIGIYEILARLVPTKYNLSAVDNVLKIIKTVMGTILPNKALPDSPKIKVREDGKVVTNPVEINALLSNTDPEVCKEVKITHKV